MRSLACLLALVITSPLWSYPMERRAHQPFASSKKIYSTLVISHVNQRFNDLGGSGYRETPLVSIDLRLGMRLYRGRFDVWGVLGARKKTETVILEQARNRVGVDYYPHESRYGQVMLFAHVLSPFKEADSSIIEPLEQGQQYDGALIHPGVYLAGVVPTQLGPTLLELELSAKAWTELYSRSREVSVYDEEDRLTSEKVDPTRLASFSEGGLALIFSPSRKRELTLTLKGELTSSEQYNYYRNEGGTNIEPRKYTNKASRLLLRSSYRIARRVIFQNEFQKNYLNVFEKIYFKSKPIYTNSMNLLYSF